MRVWVILGLLFLAACTREIPFDQGLPIETYFCPRDDCVSVLVGLLDGAEEAKCALYSVSLPRVQNALEDVDWVTEDGKSPLMHNKFCVINKSMVLTGSWNPTRSTKANNVVIVHSRVLANNYLDEFDELPGGYRRVVNPQLVYNNKLIENYFCPEDDCKERVMELLQGARQNIVFMLASFTDQDIMRLLNEKHNTISVEGIIDKTQKKAIATVGFAKTENVHHKVFIIDGKTVITGSYNPTKSGNERNDENILVIHDFAVAQEFLEEYNHLIS